jgi:hypothetical protein
MTTSQWSSSNRASMSSNVSTNRNQGGGSKKAGFPYMVGRDCWASIAITPISLSRAMTTKLPVARPSRGVGNRPGIGVYFTQGLPGRS